MKSSLFVLSFLTFIHSLVSENLITYSYECYKCYDCDTINKRITPRCFTNRGCYTYIKRSGSKKSVDLDCVPYADYCDTRLKETTEDDQCYMCYTDLCNGQKMEVSDQRANITRSELDDYDAPILERSGRAEIEPPPMYNVPNIDQPSRRSSTSQIKPKLILFVYYVNYFK